MLVVNIDEIREVVVIVLVHEKMKVFDFENNQDDENIGIFENNSNGISISNINFIRKGSKTEHSFHENINSVQVNLFVKEVEHNVYLEDI